MMADVRKYTKKRHDYGGCSDDDYIIYKHKRKLDKNFYELTRNFATNINITHKMGMDSQKSYREKGIMIMEKVLQQQRH